MDLLRDSTGQSSNHSGPSSFTLGSDKTFGMNRKSPHKIFKNKKIPLSYFLPVGNPVVVLSNDKKSKLDPPDNGGVINSKSIDFLDKVPNNQPPIDHNELLIEEKEPPASENQVAPPKEASLNIKEEESDSEPNVVPEEDGSNSDTLHVKPAKYSYFSQDPKSFKKTVTSENASSWKKAIHSELDNIEKHEVWEDQPTMPKNILHLNWVFKTKPATLDYTASALQFKASALQYTASALQYTAT
ncbi:hypothetical protein PCASD_05972 [Puccinia coronata f. sp. avenae]|uniref:Reverse transcriptase Ty1/copia-type domain-containing protein n=1 Tax=Puccinia coronata f. sp. avenae TaxID=200324 RepID=A0A2N5V9Y9_9BASI|nr:hypothetical protein PCASD_05972 [Puccinia coronata f. sp. avenae]